MRIPRSARLRERHSSPGATNTVLQRDSRRRSIYRVPKTPVCRPAIRPYRRCSRKSATQRHSSESGIWGGASDYFNHGPGSPAPLYEDELPIERHGYMTNLLGDRAVQTVEAYARSKEPFLLSLHFTAPHWPWEGRDDEAESKRIKGRLRHYDGGTQKTYITKVQSLDANIGRVLQALDVQGLAENTIVIFTSDNSGERFSKVWPFSGMKSELLEGGLRIPAIVRWPGRVAAGSVSEQVMISMDWMPTLLAAAGTQMESAYPPDGENLLPTLISRPAT